MDDTLVSSRISPAKKEAGVSILETIGATTSDLINSAFDYVIATRQLPVVAPKDEEGRQACDFSKFVAGSTVAVDWGQDECSYKDILRKKKVADYESLA